MPLTNKPGDIGRGLSDGFAQIAKDAVADIGNTYQAFLWDTGWDFQNAITEMTQDVSEQVAKEQLVASNDHEQEINWNHM